MANVITSSEVRDESTGNYVSRLSVLQKRYG